MGKNKVMYPEHEKLKEIQEYSQICADFLDYLTDEHELILCESEDTYDHYYPCHLSKEKLLAEFFDINLEKLEQEKRQMLESLK